jgi:hypothetical protein
MKNKSKFICHRANLWGPDKNRENKTNAILDCIKLGYDVEIDILFHRNKIYLGHDKKEEIIDINFLLQNRNKLWIHCKDLKTLDILQDTDLNYFWHQTDDYTLTSKKIIWAYPNKKITENCVIVCQTLQETKNYMKLNPFKICTDWVSNPKF